MRSSFLILGLIVFVGFALTTTIVGAQGNRGQGPPGADRSGGPAIVWTPEVIAAEVPVGGLEEVSVDFEAKRELEDVDVWIVPELDNVLSPSPAHFDEIAADEPNTIQLDISLDDDAQPGTVYDGTLQLRADNRTLARPLAIEITVVEEEQTVSPVQTLAPGGTVAAVDGVKFGAPEGALDEAVEIEIRETTDSEAGAPLPEGWNDGGLEMVGNFYEVSASHEVSTPYGEYLVIGLPVPENISTDDLAVAVLSPPGSVVSYKSVDPSIPEDPSMRWHLERGQLDETNELFGTTAPLVSPEPRVYALVHGAGFSAVAPELTTNQSLPPIEEQEFAGFQDECVNNFQVDPCTTGHQQQTEDVLAEAYEAWVTDLGLGQPRLQHTLVDIDFATGEAPLITLLYKYDYLLAYSDRRNGTYAVEEGIGVTFFPADDTHPVPEDLITRHEFFHALQYGYENTFDNRHDVLDGVVEGVATAAEMSLEELIRSDRADIPGREPRHVDVGLLRNLETRDIHAYASQDFWVYIGRRIESTNPEISYLIPLFERGSLLSDLEHMLQDDATFESLPDAYWQWVLNQSFEKTQLLGFDDDGNDVPNAEQCAWSGHGSVEPFPIGPDLDLFGMTFDLEPLNSSVFEVTLEAGEDPRIVRTAIGVP